MSAIMIVGLGMEITDMKQRKCHAVPPPMTGNYMHPEPDVEVDDSKSGYDALHHLRSMKSDRKDDCVSNKATLDYPHRALKNKGIVDSGCSRHMTGNKAYLAEFQDFNGGPVAFGGSKGYITGKGKIKTGKLDFEDVCFVKELQHFNLFSVSQMCDKKNKVLFTDSECLVLSPEFKLPDENQVLLKIPRQNNMYSFNLENIVPSGGLACLIAKATTDESNKWHIRSNGQKRYFSTLMRVLSIFDRVDLNVVYQLVMDRFQDEIPEGFDRVLWGDLMVMFNSYDENKFWNSQLDWSIKKYPLRKEVLVQMLKLKLESEEESTMTLELIRFIKKILVEES
ncbi:hypothetical protein Tco_0466020 [Tanacetum coccineum]